MTEPTEREFLEGLRYEDKFSVTDHSEQVAVRCEHCGQPKNTPTETVEGRGQGWKCGSCRWWNWLVTAHSEQAATIREEAEAVGRWLGASNAPVDVIAAQERVAAALIQEQQMEEALREIRARLGTRRTGVLMDGSTTWANPLFGELDDIACRALSLAPHTDDPDHSWGTRPYDPASQTDETFNPGSARKPGEESYERSVERRYGPETDETP